ncbi:MAG: hypothetical protein QMC81_11370 [Thermoanaerobacterales bacterium]|nr:hypothetical protein [Bacillota bacterium]MDI6908069.1 hypothetical protein [Thermoanaerobacterales bacterium]
MKQRKWLWVAVILAVAVVAAIGSLRGDRAATVPEGGERGRVADLVEPALQSGRPVALVLTYQADCCESTRRFFAEHRAAVESLERAYGQKISFVWVDVALYNETDRRGLQKLARDFQVTAIPALVIVDGAGGTVGKFEGQLDETEARGLLDRLVAGR